MDWEYFIILQYDDLSQRISTIVAGSATAALRIHCKRRDITGKIYINRGGSGSALLDLPGSTAAVPYRLRAAMNPDIPRQPKP